MTNLPDLLGRGGFPGTWALSVKTGGVLADLCSQLPLLWGCLEACVFVSVCVCEHVFVSVCCEHVFVSLCVFVVGCVCECVCICDYM